MIYLCCIFFAECLFIAIKKTPETTSASVLYKSKVLHHFLRNLYLLSVGLKSFIECGMYGICIYYCMCVKYKILLHVTSISLYARKSHFFQKTRYFLG